MISILPTVDAYPKYALYPAREFVRYKMLVALAIACREIDNTLDRSFVLCIPREHLEELHKHFTAYKYVILRTCTNDEAMSFVLWLAPAVEINTVA